ncbi:FAD-dependent oxidoreductase [Pseudonocardia bannensis]|uniref:FAD-dependent oxidoreductase n=1 Tax=Pseudonocardia bannensis TaxID=630973 RepID=UPI003F68A3FA
MNDVDRPDCTDQPLAPDQQQAGAVVPAEPGGRWRCSLEELPWAPRRTDRVAVVGAGMVGLAIAWFLTGFAHNSTTRRWRRGMAAHRGVNRQALDAFDELTAGGVEAPAQPADPFLVCFSRPDERARLLEELGELDAVVIATGAWLPELTSRSGVRVPVQAGRGYSFTVAAEQLPEGPVYLPVKRIAWTLLGERLRIAGMMEFRDPDETLGQRRVRAIVDAVRPFLRGGWISASAGTNGSTPARAPRRVAPGRSADLAAGVRRRRARHVGHRARPAHRPTARRRHRQRERALRAATLPPAPVTRPPGGAGRRRSDRWCPAGSALLLHVAGCRSRPRRSATRSCDPIHDESR